LRFKRAFLVLSPQKILSFFVYTPSIFWLFSLERFSQNSKSPPKEVFFFENKIWNIKNII
jgi:hypothetical protein